MRKMSSLRLCAPPCWDCASRSSLASRIAIDFSRRLRANSTSQRTASVRARRAGTQRRRQGLDRRLQRLHRVLARALGEDRQRVVDDALGGRLLAVEHHLVDDLLDELGAVDRVRIDRADARGGAAGHYRALTPYCERAFLRSDTPAASSVPRTTLYRTPGRSLTRPPRTSTTECSCRLWPSPGM